MLKDVSHPRETGRQVKHTGTPELGALIRSARERKGLSQQELAESIGTSRGWINNVERGLKSIATLGQARKVADALGITTDEIFAAGHRVPPDIEFAVRFMDVEEMAALREQIEDIIAG